jgi:hypothetical protein
MNVMIPFSTWWMLWCLNSSGWLFDRWSWWCLMLSSCRMLRASLMSLCSIIWSSFARHLHVSRRARWRRDGFDYPVLYIMRDGSIMRQNNKIRWTSPKNFGFVSALFVLLIRGWVVPIFLYKVMILLFIMEERTVISCSIILLSEDDL